MSNTLLIVPHFWDPVCVPLGVSSLKSYAEREGHQVDLLDFNTNDQIFKLQNKYFLTVLKMFPYMERWNIFRNGTEMLSIHQLLYLNARSKPYYPGLVAEVMNMDARNHSKFCEQLDVSVFDAIFDELYSMVESVVNQEMQQKDYQFIGCYLNNSTWAGTTHCLKYAKNLNGKIKTIVGGPGPVMGITSSPHEVKDFMKKNDFIDHFVIGEGEKALVKILNNEISARIIDPVLLKPLLDDGNAFIDFKKAPTPDYGNLNTNKYLQLSVSSSRGCPFECSFCAETVFCDGFRSNTASSVYNQIDGLADKYNRSSFYICDSLSNHIITPLTQEIKDNNKPYTLDCYLRADKVCTQEKRTKLWREGGLFRARLGMESASQRILDDMVKNTTPENMEMSLYALSKHGILTSTLWIIAYPGETENEFKETLKFIKDSSTHIYQSDPWLFQYHPIGLSKSDKISSEKESKARFSDHINEILSVSPYHVDQDLSQEERFGRLEQFTCEMEGLGIPNPYSITDILKAEKRFSGLNSGKNSGWDPFSSMKNLVS
mgnify:FL=1